MSPVLVPLVAQGLTAQGGEDGSWAYLKWCAQYIGNVYNM